MKIIILVLSADSGAYKNLSKNSKKTWASKLVDGVQIFFYYGYRKGYPRPDKGKVIVDGNDLICGNPEGIHTIGYKTISSFKHLLDNYEFDYVFRCCAGSYIDQDNLKSFLEDKPRKGFYCGAKGEVGGIRYASGSGYFLSKDLVKHVVDNRGRWNHKLIDDIALGAMMKNVAQIDDRAKRIHMPDSKSEKRLEEIKSGKIDITGQYHYHFRAIPKMMLKMHEVLNNE